MGKNKDIDNETGHIRFSNRFSVSDLCGIGYKPKITKNWIYPVLAISHRYIYIFLQKMLLELITAMNIDNVIAFK